MPEGGLARAIVRICPGGVSQDLPLATISRWRIGGRADLVVQPKSIFELRKLRAFIWREGLPSVVIGDASNLLFADEGLRAICIRIGSRMAQVRIGGDDVFAEAGVWVPHFARRLMQAGLTGAEHTCGIPGTLGGLICMNGGSQRKAIGGNVVEVTAVDPSGSVVTVHQGECGFGYRRSVFQNNGAVVGGAWLRFGMLPGSDSAIRREMLSILRERRLKFPRKQPNCGSVFKSNPAMYSEIGSPGSVIERLGFKGYRIGDAMVSPQHANFFVNVGHATAADMLRLIRVVGDAVHAHTGYRMSLEVRFVTAEGQIGVAGEEAGILA